MKRLLKCGARMLADAGIVAPVVQLCAKAVERLEPSEIGNDRWSPSLLALNPGRFRGELEALVNDHGFRIIKFPFAWQARLLSLFADRSLRQRMNATDWMNPPPGAVEMKKAKRAYRNYLRRLLPRLYRQFGVDGVISATVHYKQDHDIGAVSDELGYPWIALHRENLTTTQVHAQYWEEKVRSMGSFEGSHVIVHNEVMADIFARAGFVQHGQVSALGCIRMDEYVRRLHAGEARREPDTPARVLLFSFNHGTGLFHIFQNWAENRSRGLVKLFDDVHTAVAELASEHPDIEFVIKTKWGSDWPKRVRDAIGRHGLDASAIQNLNITAVGDAHDLIVDADVCIGLGSTTLLEAALAARPVVVPVFDELSEVAEYRNAVQFKNDLHIFDVAKSKDHLKELVLKRIDDPVVDEEVMSERRRLFEKYVSSLDGDATEKYAKTIGDVIRWRSGSLQERSAIKSAELSQVLSHESEK